MHVYCWNRYRFRSDYCITISWLQWRASFSNFSQKQATSSYIQQIKEVIYNEQIRLYQSEWKPKCLFITGKCGAMLSNLEIKSYIEEVYGVKVYFDICPETSISKGLASTKIIRCYNK